jgi:ketosteroid isomerase-like protein
MKLLRIVPPTLVMLVLSVLPTSAQDSASDMDAIKRVVESTTSLANDEKLEELLALYADDARIDSRIAKAVISKAQFRELMTQIFARGNLNRADVGSLKVTIVDGTHAVTDGIVYIHTKSGGRINAKNQWKLEKRDGRWLIVETKYQ